jgi:thiamine biosynthesis lipoprotein
MENQFQKQPGSRVQRIISLLVIFSGLITACSVGEAEQQEIISETQQENELNAWLLNAQVMQGTTQGTTFIIKTSEPQLLVTPEEISQLFAEFDQELSGYIDSSLLSVFNTTPDSLFIDDTRYFKTCYLLSQSVFLASSGSFDPTVFPLVKAWGFFKDMTNPPSRTQIDSLLQFVGFQEGKLHHYRNGYLVKNDPRFSLDFNAIAQGYSVDIVAQLLKKKGHQNFFIEIGGEIYVEGVNFEGNKWVIGIDAPEDENTGGAGTRNLENYISLSGKGLATSGNYRKFYEKDGERFSHTLNPFSGRPVQHKLLSATVIADNAGLADGYATAFMVMGTDATLKFAQEHPELNLEVYLLFENESGRIERAYSQGMKNYLPEMN